VWVAGLAQGDAVQCHHRVCSDDPRVRVAAVHIERLAPGRHQRLASRGQVANAFLVEGRDVDCEVEPGIFEQMPPSRRSRREDQGRSVNQGSRRK
jgi:hypothetical protein